VAYTNNDEIYLNSTSDPSFNASDDFLHVGTYTLTLYVGNRSDYGFSGNAYVALVANGAVDAQTSVSAPTAGTFTKVTLTDVVTASDANLGHGLEIALNGIGVGDGASNGQQVDWTDVVLTYTPEPLSLSIFGAGLVLTAVVVGRRKKKMPERRMA
jgi:hypothetical protein